MKRFFKKKPKDQRRRGRDRSGKGRDAVAEVKVYQRTAAMGILKTIFRLLGIAVLALAALYIIFAATLLRIVPAGSGVGPILVKNANYYGGIIPENEEVLINTEEPVSHTPLGYLKMALPFLNEDVAVVYVKAGPHGKYSWERPGIVSIDGEVIMDGLLPPPPEDSDKAFFERKFLTSEYIGLCVVGDCVPGELLIFEEDQLMGIPVKEVDLDELDREVSFFPESQSSQSGEGDGLRVEAELSSEDATIVYLDEEE